jgi:hypothetical protein
MTKKYGLTEEEWDLAKFEIRELLVERAKLRGMIPYSELTAKVTTIHLEPDSYTFHAMLGEISSEEDTQGRGMLTVIAVHKTGDMQPGPSFFELAERLHRDTSDILRCWIDELKKVYTYWSLPRP